MIIQNVINVISKLRIAVMPDEYLLQQKIAEILKAGNINFSKEYYLGKGSRVDFMTNDRIVIEVKKGKPNRTMLISQINRYAEYDDVDGIIIVVETSIRDPITVTNNGKPCKIIGLRKLWGIAL